MTPNQVANQLRRIAAQIDRMKNPSRVRVTANLRQVLAAVGEQKTQAEWEQLFYGESGPMSDEDIGSQAFWLAFQALGWRDWTPASDVNVVVNKMKELAVTQNWKGGVTEKELNDARENFHNYKRFYEHEYMNGNIGSNTPAT